MPKIVKSRRRGINPNRRASRKAALPSWRLQTAKARLSEVFRLARTEGPQLITRRGKDGVVMIPVEQFDLLVTRSRQPENLVQFFRESPLAGVNLDLLRDKDAGRDTGI